MFCFELETTFFFWCMWYLCKNTHEYEKTSISSVQYVPGTVLGAVCLINSFNLCNGAVIFILDMKKLKLTAILNVSWLLNGRAWI